MGRQNIMVGREYMSGAVHLQVDRERRRGRRGGKDLGIDTTFRDVS